MQCSAVHRQADLGVWPGGVGSCGVDAAQEVAVLEPRLECGSILALGALWSVLPELPAEPMLQLPGQVHEEQHADHGDVTHALVVGDQEDCLREAAQRRHG
jgi:hypothetical protein